MPEEIAGCRFRPWCDNQPFCDAVRNGRSKCLATSWLLQELHTLQALHHFEVQLDWVPSEENVAADAASRQDWDRFFSAVAGHEDITHLPLTQVSDQVLVYRHSMSSQLVRIARSDQDMPLDQ